MQVRTVLTASLLAVAFAGTAFAETPNAVPEAAFTASKTRAQVQAELQAYKQAGVNPWSISFNPVRNFRGTLTREAVVADYLASRDEVHALTSEDSGSTYLAQARPFAAPVHLAGEPQRAQ